MSMMQTIKNDGLTAGERAEIFRRQMLIERDRLVVLHARLQMYGVDDHNCAEAALKFRLDADEIASLDGAGKGCIDDFLVTRIDLDDDEGDIVVMAWSDIEKQLHDEQPADAAALQLFALGRNSTPLTLTMAKKIIHQARIEAIREYRATLINPGAAYAPVPVAGMKIPVRAPQIVAAVAAPHAHEPATPSEWLHLTPTEAAVRFFRHNPRTGGQDGKARSKSGAWRDETRQQFMLPALLLEQVMEGRPLASVTQDDLLNLNDCFDRLHGPSFRKSERQRQMTIREIVAETEALVLKNEQTIKDGKAKLTEQDCAQMLRGEDLGLGIGTTNRH